MQTVSKGGAQPRRTLSKRAARETEGNVVKNEATAGASNECSRAAESANVAVQAKTGRPRDHGGHAAGGGGKHRLKSEWGK